MKSADEFGPIVYVRVSATGSLPRLTAAAHEFA